jgi:hypothetical protein
VCASPSGRLEDPAGSDSLKLGQVTRHPGQGGGIVGTKRLGWVLLGGVMAGIALAVGGFFLVLRHMPSRRYGR